MEETPGRRSDAAPPRWRPPGRCSAFVLTAVLVALGLIGAWHLNVRQLAKAEWMAQDFIQRHFDDGGPPTEDLVFLAIDHASIRLDGFAPEEIDASPALRLMAEGWPWKREIYPILLDRLFSAGARVVVLDVLFPAPREGDEEFRKALERYGRQVVIGSNFGEATSTQGITHTLQWPSDSLVGPMNPDDPRVGYLNFWPDADGVVRRVHYQISESEAVGSAPQPDEPVFDSLAAKALKCRGDGKSLPVGTAPRRIRFAGPPATFTPRSACDLFDAKKWDSPEYRGGEFFKGKTVVIGVEGNFMNDQKPTPVGLVTGAEIHLNAIHAALHGRFLTDVPRWTGAWLVILAAALSAWLCHVYHGVFARAAMLAALAAAWPVIATVAMVSAGVLLPIAAPVAAISVTGLGCLGRDYWLERREKHRIRAVLDTYVAKNVVELVLAEGDSFATALEGQKRRATLLFSDIRGFTSMTEESDASQLIGQLNEYFRGMVDAVLAEDGTLQQFIGDAILAVWGDTHTIAPEIGAARAVNSALRMKRSLQELNREWSGRQGRRPLEIGIGINHGEVVVGNIGHPMRMRFGIVGDPINTASRIESATKSYGIPILVGHSVEELTRGLFHYRDVDRVRFKGKSAAMEIHEPLAPIHELPPPWLADYHEALRIYRSGAFGEARTAFLTLAACIPEDPLCRMYLSRCETHLKNRPPGEWDAVHVLSSK